MYQKTTTFAENAEIWYTEMKTKQKMEKNQTPEMERETASLTSAHWRKIKDLIINGDEYQTLQLEENLECRLVPLNVEGWSVILAHNNRDVFHFMWEEVTGLVNISHRIVNPDYRGQGIASEVLYAIEQRVQRQSNQHNVRYSLMIETTQLSVVKLGLKRGMTVTRGKGAFDKKTQLRKGLSLEAKTHVVNQQGQRVPFRLSKPFVPTQASIIRISDHIRTNTLQVLNRKAA